MEEGSTTTPFNMMLLNETSRFHVAIKVVEGGAKKNEKVRLKMHELVSELKNDVEEARRYIVEKKAGTWRNSEELVGWIADFPFGQNPLL
jgi:xylulose-5-phosphate/fructose-6-phosphate phosphoketolase